MKRIFIIIQAEISDKWVVKKEEVKAVGIKV